MRNSYKEQYILQIKDPWSAYMYSKYEIKDRWPEAEEFIKTDTWTAYVYALDIIRGRWPEAEEFIKKEKDSQSACFYARDVIKGRWPEAEEFIKKNVYWKEYISYICKECNGEGVINYGIGGAEEECSTCFGKGFDPIALKLQY